MDCVMRLVLQKAGYSRVDRAWISDFNNRFAPSFRSFVDHIRHPLAAILSSANKVMKGPGAEVQRTNFSMQQSNNFELFE